ncbi:MAG: thioredoxin family protein [Paramuribaculum sp.]|nr:thioredoxin family protein [Paramuribaculum sp.]
MNRLRSIIAFVISTLVFGIDCYSQLYHPVKWTSSVSMTSDNEGKITFTASLESGWHIYGLELPSGGPQATVFDFTKTEGAELVGGIVPSTPAHEVVDEMYALKLSWWESNVTFTQRFKLLPDSHGAKFIGNILFMACTATSCTAPAKEPFDLTIGSPNVTQQPDEVKAVKNAINFNLSKNQDTQDDDSANIWAPVKFPESESGHNSSLIYIFIWGFLGGLLALMTPCVWPMIPLTVSFFLKRSGSKRRSIGDALIYGGAIIVIYLALGLTITAVFGAGKLNELATNAVFNLIFFAMLVVFAISFFGAFDIKLPAKWSNKMDSKAERTTGLISIFFMAFTLALVSFSCTGPIIGTLLVETATKGSIAGPAIGMGAFALALAIPFALFAIFPTMLKEMPRSGGWLNSVKVVLGFLELALAFKFLSVADLAYGWHILDREIFLALWIVIFALLGIYLLGKIRFSHDAPVESVGILRFFLALISFSMTVYLLPGLWGAPLKGVSAFVPPLYTQDFNLYESSHVTTFDDYEEGMKYASEHKMPVLVDFSGYGCVNCRKMEGAVFDAPAVKGLLKENFVMITLMVDDKSDLPQPINVIENDKQVLLETVGDKWSFLQRYKFAASIQPYYVILNNAGQPMGMPYYYDENIDKFVNWLTNGLNNYEHE